MFHDRRHRARFHIARDAYFKRNLLLTKLVQQCRIVNSADSVSNPLGANFKRSANRRGSVGFSRVRGQPQPCIAGIPICLPEIERGSAQFIAADAKRYRAVAHVARRQPGYLHHMISAELANGIEVPPDFHTGRLTGFFLCCANRSPDFIEIQRAPKNHTRADCHFRVSHAVPGQRFDHAPCDQCIILGAAQPLCNEFEAIDKAGEIAECPDTIDLLARQIVIEHHDGRAVHGAFQMEVKLGERHIIEVLMNAAAMEAIVGGYHGDAFSVLGPHPVNIEKGKVAWEVRAFLPQAKSAQIVIDGSTTEMEKRHRDGFYVAELRREPGAYQFLIEDWHGGSKVIEDPYRFWTVITDFDLHLHSEGTLYEAWMSFGAHLATLDGVDGVRFAVWAPNAEFVSVAGDFNDWDTRRHPMRLRNSGVWEIFLPGVLEGQSYKYLVRSKNFGHQQLKADPYGFRTEVPPKSASIVCDIGTYEWRDEAWMTTRADRRWLKEPVSIYEVHLESWMRGPAGESLDYRQFAIKLVEYAKRMGYTHIELMPIQEHPFSGSWGYQLIGYFAPTSRFGDPRDFMYFVDVCHQAGIGVIVDWVPAHFPKDAHGLAFFDGTALYEHADPRQGEHLDWGTLIFNFGRNEVREFLISNALFWLKRYHIDGLRVDAVASMLYLDYSRKEGEWIPNRFGGRENLDAIDFLRRFNELAHGVPGAITIAEESTAFPAVSRPVYANGLGFTMKWNMGWMHDMLSYFSIDPVYRRYHHNQITFSMLYAFTENFVLPISHDEVVYGKQSLLSKMPGDEWQKFANVRAFLAYMYAHPGKKLLFMGSDIGEYQEWNYNSVVPWPLLQFPMHAGLQAFVKELNRIYREQPALYQVDFEFSGFEWIDFSDVEKSVISFLRRGEKLSDSLLIVCNFTPVPRNNYAVGVPEAGFYREILNSDAEAFGGSNMGNSGGVMAAALPRHNRPASISITIPPLAVVIFQRTV
jgi:1,4-alpha-glucan branching enzyme